MKNDENMIFVLYDKVPGEKHAKPIMTCEEQDQALVFVELMSELEPTHRFFYVVMREEDYFSEDETTL